MGRRFCENESYRITEGSAAGRECIIHPLIKFLRVTTHAMLKAQRFPRKHFPGLVLLAVVCLLAYCPSSHGSGHLEVKAAGGDCGVVNHPVEFRVVFDSPREEGDWTYRFWVWHGDFHFLPVDGDTEDNYVTWVPPYPGTFRVGVFLYHRFPRGTQWIAAANLVAPNLLHIFSFTMPKEFHLLARGTSAPIYKVAQPQQFAQRIEVSSQDPAVAQVVNVKDQCVLRGVKDGSTVIQAKLGTEVVGGFYVNVITPKLTFRNAIQVPGRPSVWVCPVSAPPDSHWTHEGDTVTAHFGDREFDLNPFDYPPKFQWRGGEGDDSSTRYIRTDKPGVQQISASLGSGIRARATLIVVAIEKIEAVSAGLHYLDGHCAVSAAANGDPLELRAVVKPSQPGLEKVLPKLLFWQGGTRALDNSRRAVSRLPGRYDIDVHCGNSSAALTLWMVSLTLDSLEKTVSREGEPVPVALNLEPPDAPGKVSLDVSRARGLVFLSSPQPRSDATRRVSPPDRPIYPELYWVRAWRHSSSPQEMVLRYKCGDFKLEKRVALRIAQPALGSRVCLRVYQALRRGSTLKCSPQQCSSLAGGLLFGSLEISLAPGEGLASGVKQAFLRVNEDSPLHRSGSAAYDVPISFLEKSRWQKRVATSRGARWVTAPYAPAGLVNRGSRPITLRSLVLWNSMKRPLGHKGLHSLTLLSTRKQPLLLPFISNGKIHSLPVPGTRIHVSNLTITSVKTDSGNAEYMRADPESQNPRINNPHLQVQFIDMGSQAGETYECRVTFLNLDNPTSASVTRRLDASTSHKLEVSPPPSDRLTAWGFDVTVVKRRGAEVLDTQRWLSEYFYFEETRFWRSMNGEENYSYLLHGSQYSRPPQEIRVQAFSNDSPLGLFGDGDTAPGKWHTALIPPYGREAGVVFALVFGTDAEGYRYRDHRNRTILPERGR